MATKVKISFTVQGHWRQEVKIVKAGLTPERLIDLLNDGSAWTTIEKGGKIVMVSTDETLAEITHQDNNLEYDDFSADPD